MKPRRLDALLKAMMGRAAIVNAIQVSLFVGTCLNVINLGPAIWRGASVEWGKFALNYVVPFLVASYSAARMDRKNEG